MKKDEALKRASSIYKRIDSLSEAQKSKYSKYKYMLATAIDVAYKDFDDDEVLLSKKLSTLLDSVEKDLPRQGIIKNVFKFIVRSIFN